MKNTVTGGNAKEECPPDTATSSVEKAKQAPAAKKEDKRQHQKLKMRAETTSYVYDGLSLNLLEEYKGTSASQAEYYYANGQVIARKMFGLKGSVLPDREAGLTGGGTYYYLTDALGSVTDLTNQKGDVVAQYRYDAFGGLFTGEVGPYNSVGLTGKSYDAKTGLMDYSARWYDPRVGRFTQVDPLSGHQEDPVTQNRYAYVGNNPLNASDPTGMECTSPTVDWVGVIYSWSCTSTTITGSETRSNGVYNVGYQVTTYYRQGRLVYADGTSWEGTPEVTVGSPVPWEQWIAPPPDPDGGTGGGDTGGGTGGGSGGSGGSGGDSGGGGSEPPPPPPPDPAVIQAQQRQYADTVMEDVSGEAPASDDSGYSTVSYSPSHQYWEDSSDYRGYDTTAIEGIDSSYDYPSSPEPTPAVNRSGSWWSRAVDSVSGWAKSVDWERVGQGVYEVGVGIVEITVGTSAIVVGCATVVACGASIAGAYADLDGASRIVSGVADIWHSRDDSWEPETANYLKNGYKAVLGEEKGAMAYEITGALARPKGLRHWAVRRESCTPRRRITFQNPLTVPRAEPI